MIDNSDQVNSLQILHMPWCGTQVKILIRSNKILFPCIPCRCRAVKSGNFPTDYFIHLALLITAMRHLHSVNVYPVSMESAQVLLDNFVPLLPRLYNERQSTCNSQVLLHLLNRVLENGPLLFTPAFVFKSFIGHLKNLYNGTQGIPHQTIENLDLSQSYKSFLASNCKGNEEVKHFASVLRKYCERC